MEISKESWTKYVETMAAINKKASRIMQAYIDKNGYEDRKKLIERAYQISSIYGEANGSLACQMYDEIARLQGAHVPNAEMADTANYGEVAKAVQGTMINQNSTVPGTVERLTKQVGADTMLKNAKRDGAEWAWIPGGSETCAFCIALASQGWMPASRAQVHGSHASHIHANCKCEFAIRFDKKSNVEGYDPDHYYDMYYNASSSKDSKKKINALRRQLSANKNINYSGGRIINKYLKGNTKEYKEAVKWAKSYYGEILKKSTDTAKISKKTGLKKELIDDVKNYAIKNHAFVDDLYFEYDPFIALSWQRLAEGNPEACDLTLLDHEYYEMTLKKINPEWPHGKAHFEAEKIYNYRKEVEEYYAKIEKSKENK